MTLDGRVVHLGVWEMQMGRSSIYLMDTDIEANHPDDRQLSHQLYSGDNEMRLRQEIVLGIGGVRVLRALGTHPDVWQRQRRPCRFHDTGAIREYVEEGLSAEEAHRRVAASTVFTTHTPVAAGHDAFSLDRMDRYFKDYVDRLGLAREELFELGRHPHDDGRFHMSTLAIRMSDARNGVSERHGEVARRMWRSMWPNAVSDDEVPIGHVTNGIHVPSWVSPPFRDLFHRYLGPDWELQHDDAALWERALDLPDHLVWEAHKKCRGRLFTELRMRARGRCDRRRVGAQPGRGGGYPARTDDPDNWIRPQIRDLQARHPRSSSDLDRASAGAGQRSRSQPLQLVFSGKAHPADKAGQALITRIVHEPVVRRNAFAGKIAVRRGLRYERSVASSSPAASTCGSIHRVARIEGIGH